ncbi:hypothetical protein B0H21DRAFT_382038 [Amylocystis lapponica]|nr:hypothetical protein B0H21DRAFT_382038 [Amylocystis lapponica]
MVGLFGHKSSPSHRSPTTIVAPPPPPPPPPPYNQDGSENPVLATETTTTTTHIVTTTTQTTTTHFFSLPLWRRRGSPAFSNPGSSPGTARISTDEMGMASAFPTVLMRDKDLPPTPPTHVNVGASSRVATSPVRRQGDVPIQESTQFTAHSNHSFCAGPSSLMPRNSPYGESSAQPTVALARAALGLGLPHIMPSVSASSSSSDLHALTIVPPPVPGSPPRTSTSVMRRVRSFHKDQVAETDVRQRRQSRGLSLGPIQFTSLDKGKEKQHDPEPEPPDMVPPAPKPLSRKSSFWSRKRNISHAATPQSNPPATLGPKASLPSLQPVSPFNVDTNIPPRHDPSVERPPSLHRRHSERTRTTSLKTGELNGAPSGSPALLQPPHRRVLKRPQTADTSATSSRFSSFFPDIPQVITSSPPLSPSTPHVDKHLPEPQTPPPPHNQPVARPRATTNPPLLHRLSMNLFGSSPSSSASVPSVAPTTFDAVTASPSSSFASSRPSLSRPSVEIPRPRAEEEPPEVYLHRLTEAVSKAEVATVLASSADGFHARALRVYIEGFAFTGDPLDVAVRKLLMDVGLPRETQQIDRVIEAFAARYVQCNPNLFTSDDHPYILAFSMIMLHTDAFNKSNKRKMTKPDYVKNTRLPGVAPEVLDCFYDNIVFAPFIFIEDPLDVNGQRGLVADAFITRRMSTMNLSTPGGLNASGSTLLGKSNKIDPYYLITRNLMSDLRVDVRAMVPSESPYFYQGTGGPWDEEELLRAFAMAGVVEVNAFDNRYQASPWFGLGVSGPQSQMLQPLAMMSMIGHGPVLTLKVTKVGLLQRKEDTIEGGRRAINRKWREWSVLLTGSQLLFFRETSWAPAIQAEIESSSGHALFPHTGLPQPDELLSVKDTVAVFDKSYTKHPHTIRLVISDGRQYLLQTSGEKEMNEWISRINYASTFKTAGVRMRALGMSSKDIELTGIAAATSHLRDIQHQAMPAASPRIRTWYGRTSEDGPMSSRDLASQGPWRLVRDPSAVTSDSNLSMSQMDNTSRLFKATFDQVKTELAAGFRQSSEDLHRSSGRLRAHSLESMPQSPPMSPMSDMSETLRGSSRSEIVRTKLRDLEAKISLAQTQLEADLRLVRNLGVLTPFQRATRDRIHAAVQAAAKRIMLVRLDLEKLVCYRDVLADDLTAEERNWQWTRKIAMRAATEKLQSQQPQAIPRMTLSLYLDEADRSLVSSPRSIPRTENTAASAREPDSSFADSFFSALDSSTDWEEHPSSTLVDSGPISSAQYESPMTSPADGGDSRVSDGSYPFPDMSEHGHASQLVLQSSTETAGDGSEHAGHEKFYTAAEIAEEQAEEWNKTRAAKRVSLVRVPADLRISVLFGKQGRAGGENTDISEDAALLSPVLSPVSSPVRGGSPGRDGSTTSS